MSSPTTVTGRPSMVAWPPILPSPGVEGRSATRSETANVPTSSKLPGSTSAPMLSRTVGAPSECTASILAAPPISDRTRARRRSNSSLLISARGALVHAEQLVLANLAGGREGKRVDELTSGTLYEARCSAHQATSAAASTSARTACTNATGCSPRARLGTLTTPQAATSGWLRSTISISTGYTLMPLTLIISLRRPSRCTSPWSSIIAMSPVWSQPSRSAVLLSSGRFQ
jgi:hypothetical protein